MLRLICFFQILFLKINNRNRRNQQGSMLTDKNKIRLKDGFHMTPAKKKKIKKSLFGSTLLSSSAGGTPQPNAVDDIPEAPLVIHLHRFDFPCSSTLSTQSLTGQTTKPQHQSATSVSQAAPPKRSILHYTVQPTEGMSSVFPFVVSESHRRRKLKRPDEM